MQVWQSPTTSGKGGKLRAISAAPTSKMIHPSPADLQPSKKKNGWVVARILATLKRLETQRVDKTDNQQAQVFVNEEVAKKKREKKSVALWLMKPQGMWNGQVSVQDR